MPAGDPNEGFASNYGYGGMPGTTTGMALGGYAGTGNPQIGAQGRYQAAAMQRMRDVYGQGAGSAWAERGPRGVRGRTGRGTSVGTVTPVAPEVVAPVVTPTPAPAPINYSGYRAPYNPTMDTTQYPDFSGLGSTPYSDEELGNTASPAPQQGYDPLGSVGRWNGTSSFDPDYGGAWGNLRNAVSGFGNMVTGGNRRQFGGPVAPGQQYTVGENGPETLQMGPGGGGQVIPNNPMDRIPGGFPGSAGQPGMGGGGAGQLGGMNPQTLQALFQMIQQRKQGQAPGGQSVPQSPQMTLPLKPGQMPSPGGTMGQGPGGAMGQPPGGSFRLGDWRNRMGIEGLSRPPRPNMGFGGSGLGIPGVMPHLANRGGLGGGTRMG